MFYGVALPIFIRVYLRPFAVKILQAKILAWFGDKKAGVQPEVKISVHLFSPESKSEFSVSYFRQILSW